MVRMRSLMRCIAVAWLFCHAAVALGTVVLAAGSAHARIECTCVHGDHAVCPMHHRPAANPALCLLTSAAQDGAAIPTTLFMGAGLLPAVPRQNGPDAADPVLPTVVPFSSPRPAPPDPPPPRF